MLMFREEKSPEDEIKAWQFWHSRQHSVKQRILDAGKICKNVNHSYPSNHRILVFILSIIYVSDDFILLAFDQP